VSEQKLTDWYAPQQKPVKIGVYLRKFSTIEFYAMWNGNECLDSRYTAEDAAKSIREVMEVK
jgi:hypothetical protein